MDDKKEHAAEVIQRAWRRFINRAPYKWCRAMMTHAERAETAQALLKFISPMDAALIDNATGARVRLRLGVYSDQDGDKLAIYYKMFTSRPIIDLCASSPRQYTHQTTKQPTIVHTKNVKLPAPETPEQVYQRQDNNQWRVVAWDSLRSTFCLVKQQDSKRGKKFNFSSTKRKEERQLEAKWRQRAWMSSLYCGKEEDDDVDDLVSWAADLNFEEYQRDWTDSVTLPH